MMQAHLNAMRREAATTGQESAGTRLGTISGYDASNYLAKVLLQPDGVETGWLPIASIGVGNGWGIQVAPNIGDVVEVEFQDGGIDAALIAGRFFNSSARPNSVPPGEVWLVHKGGQFIKMLSDGSISSKGTWNHQGDLNVTGNETVGGNVTAQGTVQAPNVVGTTNVTFGGKSGVAHTHSGVQTGSSSTGAPN
jgi:Type VI secretion system/phage-baseplate injector OB domain/GpV Apex motif